MIDLSSRLPANPDGTIVLILGQDSARVREIGQTVVDRLLDGRDPAFCITVLNRPRARDVAPLLAGQSLGVGPHIVHARDFAEREWAELCPSLRGHMAATAVVELQAARTRPDTAGLSVTIIDADRLQPDAAGIRRAGEARGLHLTPDGIDWLLNHHSRPGFALAPLLDLASLMAEPDAPIGARELATVEAAADDAETSAAVDDCLQRRPKQVDAALRALAPADGVAVIRELQGAVLSAAAVRSAAGAPVRIFGSPARQSAIRAAARTADLPALVVWTESCVRHERLSKSSGTLSGVLARGLLLLSSTPQ